MPDEYINPSTDPDRSWHHRNAQALRTVAEDLQGEIPVTSAFFRHLQPLAEQFADAEIRACLLDYVLSALRVPDGYPDLIVQRIDIAARHADLAEYFAELARTPGFLDSLDIAVRDEIRRIVTDINGAERAYGRALAEARQKNPEGGLPSDA